MSLFSKILEKLGLKHATEQPAPPKPVAPSTQAASQVGPTPTAHPQVIPGQPVSPQAGPKLTPPPQYAPGHPPTPQAGQIAPPPAQYASTQPPAVQPEKITPAAPTPISMVDVVSKLEHLAAANPYKLDWKVSIVDLLKLLGLDSSYEARKDLAIELGCPAEKMSDSAQMNTWLHKTVLQKIAENGGNIPKELLD